MSEMITAVRGYFSYRGREGHVGFLLHRITGLGTILFLGLHIIDTAFVYFAPALYADVINIYRSTAFGIGEIILVFCVVNHGVNGLRIAFLDLIAPRFWNIPAARSSVRISLGIAITLWLPAAFFMLRSLLINNYGLFGG
jgi:succinate dehydrogenase / fumarate reductase cytochrome b subunit